MNPLFGTFMELGRFVSRGYGFLVLRGFVGRGGKGSDAVSLLIENRLADVQ